MSTAEAAAKKESVPALKRVNASDPVYGEILDFLNDEAYLLDDDQHKEWLGLLTEDISYVMPVRTTLYRRDGKGFDGSSFHFSDNLQSMTLRVRRSVDIPSAYDRDPAPRIRRMISNVVVRETDKPGEYAVTSSIALFRNRFDNPTYDILTAKREDIIRRTDSGLKIAKRTILLDQAALGSTYLNVFM